MRSFEQQKIKTRIIIFRNKILRPKFLFKVLVTIVMIVIVLPFCLYLIIYTGYSQKIINSPDQIRDEISVGVLISDPSKDNIKNLTDAAKDAFQKRKITFLYIYLFGDSQSLTDENVEAMLDKVPKSEIKVDRSAQSPYQVCDSAKNIYNLSKFVTLSYKDSGVRSAYICNNLGMYTQTLVPTVNENDLKVAQSGFLDYLNDINKVLLGITTKF